MDLYDEFPSFISAPMKQSVTLLEINNHQITYYLLQDMSVKTINP